MGTGVDNRVLPDHIREAMLRWGDDRPADDPHYIVGWQPITEVQSDGLAHAVRWRLITTEGTYEIDKRGYYVRATMLHRLDH